MLTVFNVGQGDACLLHPDHGCALGQPPLLIDTGPSNARIFRRLTHTPAYRLMITHSHRDHLGGVPALLRNNSPQLVYIPYWLPEIERISFFLRKHFSSETGSIGWKRLQQTPFTLIAEGDRLCEHAMTLNPPRQPETVFATIRGKNSKEKSLVADRISEGPDEDGVALRSALRNLRERGLDLPEEEILNYRSPISPESENRESSRLPEGYEMQARRFVHMFFIELERLASGPGRTRIDYDTARFFELTANQASAVFRYAMDEWSILFTGDADNFVFDRLIGESADISARILKVPHHGSRENLSVRVLQAIAPECAIVSHKNGKFGRSRDSHPHHEVIDLLDLFGIDAHYTNAVIKQGRTIKPAASGTLLGGMIEFA